MTRHSYGDSVPALIHAMPHLSGMPDRRRLSRFALMLHYLAHVDDTGNDPLDFLFCLAAWVGQIDQWLDFSNDWQKTLEQAPAIGYFKHHEAISGTGCFAKLSGEESLAKIMALAEVIAKYDLYGVIVSVERKKFRQIVDRYGIKRDRLPRRAKDYYNDPFFTLFHCLLATVVRTHCQKFSRLDDKIDFVFDDKNEHGSRAIRRCIEQNDLWKTTTTDVLPGFKRIYGTVNPANDQDVVALQAADLLAGQYRMYCMVNQHDKIPKPIAMLRERLDVHSELIEEDVLLPLIEIINSFTTSLVLERIKDAKNES